MNKNRVIDVVWCESKMSDFCEMLKLDVEQKAVEPSSQENILYL